MLVVVMEDVGDAFTEELPLMVRWAVVTAVSCLPVMRQDSRGCGVWVKNLQVSGRWI